MNQAGYKLIIVSDLHLSEGWDPRTKKLSRNEDFFFDVNFQRFLQHLAGKAEKGAFRYRLIVNGDFVDFLQFVKTPEAVDGEEITGRERKLGLGTSPSKTLWKLERLMENHWIFFSALREFVDRGNELFIIPGNHDIEWLMPEIQHRFREKLSSSIEDKEGFLSRLNFAPWFYYDPSLSVFIEHGSQYDSLNSFDYYLYPFRRDGTIELPAGSFFVRYLFNRVESDYPFADNMKPMSKFLCWALRQSETWLSWPPRIIKFLLFFINTIGKVHPIDKAWKQTLETRQSERVQALTEKWGLDIDVIKSIKAQWVPSAIHHSSKFMLLKRFLDNAKLNGEYYFGRAKFLQNLLGVRYVVFGHTHDADIRIFESGPEVRQPEYVNSGTWTKAFAANYEEALLKSENEFVFVHVGHMEKTGDLRMELLRWNDCLGEGERVRLFEPKA